jgi:hypothetical protein
MKKKAIEKIPYLTLPEISRSRKVKFIAVTAFKNVGHERHLFVEVYRNKKKDKAIPVVRIVLTKKDFGNYFPETDSWTREKIETDHYYYSNHFLWNAKREDQSSSWDDAIKENILLSTNDFDRIKKMCNANIWNKDRWQEYIYEHEDDITIKARRQAENRRYERRMQALKNREANTPELPEQSILDRADRIYLSEKHFLYYKKRGCWADVTCSKCGGVSDGRWKAGISYESEFQRWIEEPREGQTGTCPLCGAKGEYKCQGKVKGEHSKSIHLFLGQKYKENGFVMRYIEVSKTWVLDLMCGTKGPEMSGALEKLSGVEIARAYFLPGEKVQIDYHKHNPYTGTDFWDDCNLSGLSNISIGEAAVLSETYENMKGTMFQYSAMKEYSRTTYRYNPVDYLSRYKETPQIEILVKMGLTGVVTSLLKCRYGIVADLNAKRPDQFLGIRKCRVHQLIEKNGDLNVLETMRMEHKMGAEWSDEQIDHIAEANLRRDQLEVATAYMSVQQLLNRIEKYARAEWETGCGSAEKRLQNVANTYIDYLNMRIALGYDLHNSVYQQPRDLTAAHTKMVTESSKKEADKRLAEVKTRFSNIRKQYRKLRNRYFWEDENLLIRPARSAEEIVMEGRILHHCVGGDGYLGKQNRGETYILMVRQQADPEIPYITVEIDAKRDSIIQWYGAHDKKPDEKNMQRWLDSYIVRLKCGQLAAGAAQEASQQVLMMAI